MNQTRGKKDEKNQKSKVSLLRKVVHTNKLIAPVPPKKSGANQDLRNADDSNRLVLNPGNSQTDLQKVSGTANAKIDRALNINSGQLEEAKQDAALQVIGSQGNQGKTDP